MHKAVDKVHDSDTATDISLSVNYKIGKIWLC